MIVVTAAGGATGAAVVGALWSRGERVRALVGGSQPHPELTALSADVVATDLTDPAAVEPLLAEADALYLIWPNFDPGETAGAVALLGAARRAGVRRVVYHSVLRPQARSGAPLQPVVVAAGGDFEIGTKQKQGVISFHRMDPFVAFGDGSERMPNVFFKMSRCSRRCRFSRRAVSSWLCRSEERR